MIKLNQKAWLNPYIDMNTKLRQKAKNNVEKDILQYIFPAVVKILNKGRYFHSINYGKHS